MNIIENLLTPKKKNRPGYRLRDLRAVVLHWVAAPNQLPINTRSWWEKGEVFGSAHYIIGIDGVIMRTLPENEVGYHIGSTLLDPVSKRVYTDKARMLFRADVCAGALNNYYAIGIELEHLNMEPGDFSDETLQSAAELCADILIRNKKNIDILTTHHEVVGWKDCPRLWTNNPALFEKFKEKVKTLMEAQNA